VTASWEWVGEIAREQVEEFLPALRAEGMGVDPDDGTWLGLDDCDPVGIVHIQRRGEHYLIDDVYVMPSVRRGGVATDLLLGAKAWLRDAAEVWLLCDEDMVDFYRRRGFSVRAPQEFPEPLAELCANKGEWPRARDHIHVCMSALLR
jgi:GNAT superfamily N-acetyltransferase